MRKTKSGTTTEIKTGVKLSPQQILVASLIQASNEDLQRIINDELEKNVALESDETRSVDEMSENHNENTDGADDSEYENDADGTDNSDTADFSDFADYADDDFPALNRSDEDKEYSPITNYGSDVSFRESLQDQLSVLDLNERERFMANYIVESLEDDGYLRRSLGEMVVDLEWNQAFDTTEEELERVLVDVIQANLEPVGIGARNLKECLLLQLDEMPSGDATMKAYKVLDESFEDFKEHRFDKIKECYDFTDSDIAAIQKVVHRLNPKPGGLDASTNRIDTKASQVRPDFIVTNEGGELIVSLCDSRVPAVRISPDYNEMLESIGRENQEKADVKKGRSFIEEGIRSANMFISALVQRRRTLISTMRAIAKLQYNYFVSGNIEDLKPMALKEVAQLAKFDISTISRVTATRFVQTDFGIISLKELFTTAVAVGDGTKSVSNAAIKNALKEIVDNEDKSNPLNDDELVARLAEQGYKIARRTVVKYRDILGIPKTNFRKRI